MNKNANIFSIKTTQNDGLKSIKTKNINVGAGFPIFPLSPKDKNHVNNLSIMNLYIINIVTRKSPKQAEVMVCVFQKTF